MISILYFFSIRFHFKIDSSSRFNDLNSTNKSKTQTSGGLVRELLYFNYPYYIPINNKTYVMTVKKTNPDKYSAPTVGGVIERTAFASTDADDLELEGEEENGEDDLELEGEEENEEDDLTEGETDTEDTESGEVEDEESGTDDQSVEDEDDQDENGEHVGISAAGDDNEDVEEKSFDR
jgi:hypothetical protein